MRKLLPLILILTVLCGNPEEFSTHVFIGDEYIEVTAVGASPEEEGYSDAELKRLAAETAYILAIGKLAVVISGIKIDGVFTVIDMGHYSSQIVERVRAEIWGIRELGNKYRKLSDGSWEATSRVRLEISRTMEFLERITGEENIIPESSYSSIIFDMSSYRESINILSVYKIYDASGRQIVTPSLVSPDVLRQGNYLAVFPDKNELLKNRNFCGGKPVVLKPESIDNNNKIIIVDSRTAKVIKDNFKLVREGKVFITL